MAQSTTKRDELVARMTAPGTAAGLVLGWLGARHKVGQLDPVAIARATGLLPRRVAWALHVLRALGLLAHGATLVPLAPAPTSPPAPASMPITPRREGSHKGRPVSAPTPAAPNPEVSARVGEARRQAPGSAVETAAVWLLVTLAERPLRASEVRSRGEQVGIAWRTLQRARVAVGVEARRLGDGVGIWLRPGR